MKGKLVGNVFQFVTDIPASMKDVAFKPATNEKGEPVYWIEFSEDGDWRFSKYGITCNSIIDDKLAIVAVFPADVTMEQVKHSYGFAAVAANAYIPVIMDATQAEQEVIDACFEE